MTKMQNEPRNSEVISRNSNSSANETTSQLNSPLQRKAFGSGKLAQPQQVNYVQKYGQEHGNQQVQRMLVQRDGPGTATPTKPAAAATADPKAEAFVAKGTYGPKDVIPGADGMGGFEATYEAQAKALKVVLRSTVNFLDGLKVVSNKVVPAVPSDHGLYTDLETRANQAVGMSAPDRAAFVAAHQWKSSEKSGWLTNMEKIVQDTWAGKHEFYIKKPQWDWIGAKVAVDIQSKEGKKSDKDHLSVDSVKLPPGESLGAWVSPGNARKANDQSMVIGSNDIAPRTDNLLQEKVEFADGKTDLSAVANGALTMYVKRFQGAPDKAASTKTKVSLTGYAAVPGGVTASKAVAKERAEKVKTYMVANGFTQADSRITIEAIGQAGGKAGQPEAESARKVEVKAGDGNAQVVAAHEFGHAMGLSDEYATATAEGRANGITGTGKKAGAATDHDAIVKDVPQANGTNLPGAIHENNDSIMSWGNVVRPQHYSIFHRALKDVTKVNEWALGTAVAKPAADPKAAAVSRSIATSDGMKYRA